ADGTIGSGPAISEIGLVVNANPTRKTFDAWALAACGNAPANPQPTSEAAGGASGHAAAALPINVMNSRRRMRSPQSEDRSLPHRDRQYPVVHHSKFSCPMTVVGHF